MSKIHPKKKSVKAIARNFAFNLSSFFSDLRPFLENNNPEPKNNIIKIKRKI